jgi:hypothetical protein
VTGETLDGKGGEDADPPPAPHADIVTVAQSATAPR